MCCLHLSNKNIPSHHMLGTYLGILALIIVKTSSRQRPLLTFDGGRRGIWTARSGRTVEKLNELCSGWIHSDESREQCNFSYAIRVKNEVNDNIAYDT